MSGLRFAQPDWLVALWAVVVGFGLLLWLDRRGGDAIERLVGSALKDRLVASPAAWRRRVGLGLLALCGAFLVIALMRPQWGVRQVPIQRSGAEIMIALDVSRSMLAEDVRPNRLERAKAEIGDLLSFLDGDAVGLIAFAGRAVVLSPMTPDFGFLRLVLENLGPHSVTRGGTRLADPIAKAVKGFGPPGEASRAIFLITDGEDHESPALEAARAAAEQGIVIIAIGFGDERGSEIRVTDPRTGARTLLRDANGEPVVSRLDGELLRELALATGGAYVPAGTGLLDLQSIYEQHLARLTRGQLDPSGQSIREERYQWAVMLALMLLLASVALTTSGAGARRVGSVLVLLIVQSLIVQSLFAQTPFAEAAAPVRADDTPTTAAGDPSEHAAAAAAVEPDPTPGAAELVTPREIYNRGVHALEQNANDDAERWLSDARQAAGNDGKLQYRSVYNLGMVAAARAESLEAEKPEEALEAFREASEWFRAGIRLRPDESAARHNLEVALRRVLLLEDRLDRESQEDIEARLVELAERQRELVGSSADLLERMRHDTTTQTEAADRFRDEFREGALAQRTLLSDADELAAAIGTEWDTLQLQPQDEKASEDRMRAVELAGVLEHLHPAREWMGAARRQLRQRQGERAYRRASAALRELKRARDPLRDPVALLGAVIRDAVQLNSATSILSVSGRTMPGLAEPIQAPVWLTRDLLQEEQTAVGERTQELHGRLLAGLESVRTEAPPANEQDAFLARIGEAEPFVRSATEAFARADGALEESAFRDARAAQRDGIEALEAARERFLDLKGLIEATAAAEQRVSEMSGGAIPKPMPGEEPETPRAVQLENLDRGERLERRFAERLLTVESAAANPQQIPGGSSDDERDRLQRGQELLTLALEAMRQAATALKRGDPAEEPVGAAVERLEELRRLFFSIAEKLRELAEEQLELSDETRDAAALERGDDTPDRAPLGPEQASLTERAGELAATLAEQGEQTGDPSADEATEPLREAGKHVEQARTHMQTATAKLAGDSPVPGEARQPQHDALEALKEAIALLSPPQDQDDQDSEGGGQADGSEQPQQDSGEAQASAQDPAHLLQAVRDRDAARRQDQAQRQRVGYEPVEKDW